VLLRHCCNHLNELGCARQPILARHLRRGNADSSRQRPKNVCSTVSLKWKDGVLLWRCCNDLN
jgi:hypothetical protein